MGETILSLLRKSTAFLEEQGIDEARPSTELLLAHALDCSRIDLYVKFEQPMAEGELERFRAFIRRRLSGEPVKYITGSTEFYGLPFKVTPDVLIPRPETEHLVECALEKSSELIAAGKTPTILDIGTGSGVIAITLAKLLERSRIFAIDNSDAALSVARHNAELNGVSEVIEFRNFDFLTSDGSWHDRYDLVLSNPPYIPIDEISELQPEIRDFEPRSATTDGADGLTFYRKICEIGPSLLNPGGSFILELGFGQLENVSHMFRSAGMEGIEVIRDYSGIDRVLVVKPA